MKTLCKSLLLFCVVFVNPTYADTLLYKLSGKNNTVYLLGSIHVLRESDYPLPPAMDEAYRDSEVLVMELDLDDIEPIQIARQFIAAATAQDGQTLSSLLGESSYIKAKNLASELDTDLAPFENFEPWFTALTVLSLQMAKIGFREDLGIEGHFLNRAEKDKKPVQGLESIEFQVSLFDTLPIDQQRDFLLMTLTQAGDLEADSNSLVQAWKTGNTEDLSKLLNLSLENTNGLYDKILTERNRNWVPIIESFLQEKDDYLIIVGAGHLVGENSVVELLQESGYAPAQL